MKQIEIIERMNQIQKHYQSKGWTSDYDKMLENDNYWSQKISPAGNDIAFCIRMNAQCEKAEVRAYRVRSEIDNWYWDFENTPSIGFAMTKTLDQMIRDIEKRFLPAFLKEAAEINKKIQSHYDYINKKADLISKACKAFGIEPSKNQYSTGYAGPEKDTYIKIQAYEHSLEISINNLTIEQVEAIAKVVQNG